MHGMKQLDSSIHTSPSQLIYRPPPAYDAVINVVLDSQRASRIYSKIQAELRSYFSYDSHLFCVFLVSKL